MFQFDHVPLLLRDRMEGADPLQVGPRAADIAALRRLAREVERDYRRSTPLSSLRFDATVLSLSVLALRELDGQPLASPTDLARRKVSSAHMVR